MLRPFLVHLHDGCSLMLFGSNYHQRRHSNRVSTMVHPCKHLGYTLCPSCWWAGWNIPKYPRSKPAACSADFQFCGWFVCTDGVLCGVLSCHKPTSIAATLQGTTKNNNTKRDGRGMKVSPLHYSSLVVGVGSSLVNSKNDTLLVTLVNQQGNGNYFVVHFPAKPTRDVFLLGSTFGH